MLQCLSSPDFWIHNTDVIWIYTSSLSLKTPLRCHLKAWICTHFNIHSWTWLFMDSLNCFISYGNVILMLWIWIILINMKSVPKTWSRILCPSLNLCCIVIENKQTKTTPSNPSNPFLISVPLSLEILIFPKLANVLQLLAKNVLKI